MPARSPRQGCPDMGLGRAVLGLRPHPRPALQVIARTESLYRSVDRRCVWPLSQGGWGGEPGWRSGAQGALPGAQAGCNSHMRA